MKGGSRSLKRGRWKLFAGIRCGRRRGDRRQGIEVRTGSAYGTVARTENQDQSGACLCPCRPLLLPRVRQNPPSPEPAMSRIEHLRYNGIEAYPARVKRSHTVRQARESGNGPGASVIAGRLVRLDPDARSGVLEDWTGRGPPGPGRPGPGRDADRAFRGRPGGVCGRLGQRRMGRIRHEAPGALPARRTRTGGGRGRGHQVAPHGPRPVPSSNPAVSSPWTRRLS